MVVDVDEAPSFEPFEPAALDAIALQQDHEIEVALDALPVLNTLRAWQPAIDERHTIAEGHRDLLAELLQHHAAGQHGTYRIAIRARMRGHQDALRVLNGVTNGAIAACSPFAGCSSARIVRAKTPEADQAWIKLPRHGGRLLHAPLLASGVGAGV